MASIAAKLEAKHDKNTSLDNVVAPFGTAHVKFASPPQTAKNVVVMIHEDVRLYERKHPHKKIGWFEGEFKGGEFIVDKMVGAPEPTGRHISVHIIAGVGEGRGHFVGFAPDPRDVISHTLTVSVTADGFLA